MCNYFNDTNRGSLASLGYDLQQVYWIDTTDFFIKRQLHRLAEYIQQEFNIEFGDFNQWIIDLVYKRIPHFTGYVPNQYFQEFKDKISGYKVINTETI